MPRYIDADALIDAISAKVNAEEPTNSMPIFKAFQMGGVKHGLELAIETVRKAQTADVVPVVHGHWIPADIYHEDVYVCSVCHADIAVQINYDYRPTYKYCPMCGAKLDEVTT